MKIADLVGSFPAVSETFILSQITGLLDAGHEVDIYAWNSGNGAPIHHDVFRYGLLQRTRYVNIPQAYFTRVLKAPMLLANARAWRQPGVPLRALNPVRHGRLAVSLNLLYGSAVFPRHQAAYDIVHCQFGTLARIALALRETGAVAGKIVVSFRGADLTKAVRNGEYTDVFERCDLVLPVCDAFKTRLVSLGCDARKIRVHRSGIRVCRFKYVERHREPGDTTRLVTIARLVEKKGVAYAIRAVARLKESGRHVRYLIAGDGPLRAELERLVDNLNLRDQIQFLGDRSQEELVPILASAHIMVAPSVTAADGEQEGIPNVLKEGMAAGLPVVSTLHSGIPELVEDGRSGFLVPERDVDALADRLSWLVDHPERWAGMGRVGRARVEADYESEALNRRLVGLYQDVLRK